MAYQEGSYGGPRSTYAGPTNNNNIHNTTISLNAAAGHFPHSQSLSHHQQLHHPSPSPSQSHSHFYPNPNLNPYPHPNLQSANHHHLLNATSPPLPSSSSYPHHQPPEGQTYHPQRLPYGPNPIHNGGGPLMQPPMSLPDDHFKKPYLPQQQYMSHGTFALFFL